MSKVKVYLKNGVIFDGKYYDDEWEEIYDSWLYKKELLTLANGEFLMSEVIGLSWGTK